jgi:PiT family inorganic phosphate transporter
MWQLLSGLFLGWSLGSNDAANVFGTAVASRMVRRATAAAVCAVFVLIGALVGGREGLETYRAMSPVPSLDLAFVVALAAALTVKGLNRFGLPVSTSQAVVGALVYVGLTQSSLETGQLVKVVVCWVATPIAAALATVVYYHVIGLMMNLSHPTLFEYDRRLRFGLLAAGAYGAFALGANNVANVTGAFTGPGMLSAGQAVAVGGVAIASGALMVSTRVMVTVGRGLVRLDAFTAFVAILSEATTVHVFSIIGTPVSTSQAIVGAVIGVGLVKGIRTINTQTLSRVVFGWLGTPTTAAALAFIIDRVMRHVQAFAAAW